MIMVTGSKWYSRCQWLMIEWPKLPSHPRLPSRIFRRARWIVCGETNTTWCRFDAEGKFHGSIGHMPSSKRLFADDEELGKKDDDHRPTDGAMVSPTLRIWRLRRKRVLIGIFALYLLYLFIKHIPTDVPP